MLASKMKLAWLLVLPLSVGVVFISTQSTAAFQGPGYYSGANTCSTDWRWVSTCGGTTGGSISASQNNVIVGGVTGVGVGSPKSAFYNWLVGQAGTAGGQFVLNTMIGTTDTNVLKSRLDNPNLTMTYVSGGQPRSYGTISLRGRRQDNGAADYFFVGNYTPPAKDLLVFSVGASAVYVIEVGCANPVGGLPGLPASSVWTMQGRTTVSQATARPGQSVTFTHYVKNGGPDGTNKDIWSDTRVSGGVGSAKSGHNGFTYAAGEEKQTDTDTITIPANATNGTQYCQQVGYQPVSNSDGSYVNGTSTCVTVVAQWTITGVSLSPGSTVNPGAILQWIHTLANNGPDNMNVDLTDVRIDTYVGPSNPPPTSSNTNSIIGQLGTKRGNSGVTFVNYNGTNAQYTTTAGDIGKYICQRIAWTPSAWNAAGFAQSNWACTLVAQAPYVSLVGSAAWSGGSAISPYTGAGKFTGAATAGAGFGSFGEYGLFATSSVSNFGSGGEFWNTGASSGMNLGTRLTFANTSSFGSYSTTHAITNQVTQYQGSSNTAGVLGANGHVVASGVYVTAGNVTLNSDNAPWSIPAGVHAVIYAPNSTVTISGDMTYATGGVTSFGQLASLVIIAKDIKIDGRVQQVAGWLYATNSFVSCTEGPSAGASVEISTNGLCNKQLAVNGSVSVAKQAVNSLVLNRSYGGTGAGQPAEIIRMRPEVFLTPYEGGSNSSNMILTTMQETELPARY